MNPYDVNFLNYLLFHNFLGVILCSNFHIPSLSFLLANFLTLIQTLNAMDSDDANTMIIQDVKESHAYFDNELK